MYIKFTPSVACGYSEPGDIVRTELNFVVGSDWRKVVDFCTSPGRAMYNILKGKFNNPSAFSLDQLAIHLQFSSGRDCGWGLETHVRWLENEAEPVGGALAPWPPYTPEIRLVESTSRVSWDIEIIKNSIESGELPREAIDSYPPRIMRKVYRHVNIRYTGELI